MWTLARATIWSRDSQSLPSPFVMTVMSHHDRRAMRLFRSMFRSRDIGQPNDKLNFGQGKQNLGLQLTGFMFFHESECESRVRETHSIA